MNGGDDDGNDRTYTWPFTVHGEPTGINSMDLDFYLIGNLVLSHHCKGWVDLVFFSIIT